MHACMYMCLYSWDQTKTIYVGGVRSHSGSRLRGRQRAGLPVGRIARRFRLAWAIGMEGCCCTDVLAIVHDMGQTVAALQWQLLESQAELQSARTEMQSIRTELQSMRTELQSIRPVSSPLATAPAPVILELAPVPALASIARFAQEAIKEAGYDASVASLLQEPLDSREIAKAYDTVLQTPIRARCALRSIRELLVLKLCIGAGPWTTSSLKDAMAQAFGHPLDQDVEAQLLLAFSHIHRLAKDRDAFDKASRGCYGELDSIVAEDLFTAYVSCARTSPEYISITKRSGKVRKGSKPDRRFVCPLTLAAAAEAAAASAGEEFTFEAVAASAASPTSLASTIAAAGLPAKKFGRSCAADEPAIDSATGDDTIYSGDAEDEGPQGKDTAKDKAKDKGAQGKKAKDKGAQGKDKGA